MDKKEATITLISKNGKVNVINGKGKVFNFGKGMNPCTALAACVFETIYMAYKKNTWISDDFEIKFKIEKIEKFDDEPECIQHFDPS